MLLSLSDSSPSDPVVSSPFSSAADVSSVDSSAVSPRVVLAPTAALGLYTPLFKSIV